MGFGVWGVLRLGGERRLTQHNLFVWVSGSRVWSFGIIGFGVWSLGFGVWGLGLGVEGLGFRRDREVGEVVALALQL